MPLTIDITDAASVLPLLKKVDAKAKPVFGIMSFQHAVEHLVMLLRLSNGNMDIELQYPPEKAAKFKAYLIDAENEMTPGFRAPILPVNEVLPLQYKNVDEALFYLKVELEAFHRFFRENPGAKTVNPSLGAMDYEEWIIFHNKHFRHHLKQFGLE